VEQIDPFDVDDEVVGSTLIRHLLSIGDVSLAEEYLGRRYALTGTVVRGNNMGNRYNFPTANMEINDPHKMVPANGVYAVEAIFRGQTYKGMLNIGVKPTFGDNRHTIEVHMFNFNGNLYGEMLTVEFKKRLRDEQKFDSVEALLRQLEVDKKNSLLI
jgi:riboflavin kinase/FMN adenylyltransferase